MIYAEIQNPASDKAEFSLEYEVTRREYSRGDYVTSRPVENCTRLASTLPKK